MTGDRLLEQRTYGKMFEYINLRCRLNYAGKFHMDITPAVER